MDWQQQRRPGDQVLVIEIPAVPAGRPARDPTDERRRCDANRAEERCKGQRDAMPEIDTAGPRLPAQQVEMRVRKFVRKDTAAGTERDHAKGVQKVDVENVYFECVAGFSAFDKNRTGQRMDA